MNSAWTAVVLDDERAAFDVSLAKYDPRPYEPRAYSEQVWFRRGWEARATSYPAEVLEDGRAWRAADGLEACDWSGVPIGNKAIIRQAISLLRAASPQPVEQT